MVQGSFLLEPACVPPAPTLIPCVLPQDVQYSDIDYMERQLDFTLSPKFSGLPDLINRMKDRGMRVILILVSPCVKMGVSGTVSGLWYRQPFIFSLSMSPKEKFKVLS